MRCLFCRTADPKGSIFVEFVMIKLFALNNCFNTMAEGTANPLRFLPFVHIRLSTASYQICQVLCHWHMAYGAHIVSTFSLCQQRSRTLFINCLMGIILM